jgi:hypothetical protein
LSLLPTDFTSHFIKFASPDSLVPVTTKRHPEPVTDLLDQTDLPALFSVYKMSETATMNINSDEISLTDRDLVSLYLSYPDMQQSDHHEDPYADPLHVPFTSSSPASSPPPAHLHSSPPSKLSRYASPISSPLAPSDIIPYSDLTAAPIEEGIEVLAAEFDATLNSSNLSEERAEFLADMKSTMMLITAILLSKTGKITTDLDSVRQVRMMAERLTSSLRKEQEAVAREVKAAESVLEFTAFSARPGVEDLWSNYIQMADLIVE